MTGAACALFLQQSFVARVAHIWTQQIVKKLVVAWLSGGGILLASVREVGSCVFLKKFARASKKHLFKKKKKKKKNSLLLPSRRVALDYNLWYFICSKNEALASYNRKRSLTWKHPVMLNLK